MAKRWGKSHMAWVRSFAKKSRNPKRRRHYHARVHHRQSNPPALLNKRRSRRYSRNPRLFGFQLPSISDAIYGAGGFVGVPLLEGVASSFLPVSITQSPIGKWAVRVGAVIAETMVAKMVLGKRAASVVAIGGGSYVLVSAIKEYAPTMIPGLQAYTPGGRRGGLSAYAQGGQVAAQLAAPAFGAIRTNAFAGRGAQNIVAARFRRFQ